MSGNGNGHGSGSGSGSGAGAGTGTGGGSGAGPATVLLVANSEKIGGGNRILMDIVNGLDRSRFTPLVLAPGEGPLVDWARVARVPLRVIRNHAISKGALLKRSLAVAATVLSGRVRIIHAMAPACYRSNGLASLLPGVARICHLGFPPGSGELEWCFRFGPDAVVACYEGQAREVARTIAARRPRCRVLAIPNGIDTRLFRMGNGPGNAPVEGASGGGSSAGPSPSPSPTASAGADGNASLQEARERLRGGGRHVAVILGHLSEVKGYPTFVEGAARVARQLEGCVFLAVGGETIESGYRAHLERQAAALGLADRIRFLGFRRDVADILRAADVMVLPSRAEGLPLAVLEAMACGKPVVATPVGGVPEAVLDGVTGFLVPPDDPDALARGLLRLFRDPGLARRMGEAGRRRIEARFSLGRFLAQIHQLYDDVLATRPTLRPAA